MSIHSFDYVLIDRFAFRGFNGCQCHCALEFLRLADGRTCVIATEVEDNPGTSITNVAEHLASAVCDRFCIAPEKLVWIERYGYPSATKARDLRMFDLVTFTQRSQEAIRWSESVLASKPDGWPGYFDEPEWRPMTDRDWLELGLEPRQPKMY